MPTYNFIPNFNCFSHIIDCVPRTWNYMAGLQEFKTKHRELNRLREQLKTLNDDVKSRVADAETRGLVCIPSAGVWLHDVEASEDGLNEVLDEGSLLLQRSCLGACLPCGCWNSQNFLGKVTSEISLVKDLIGRGNFEIVSQSPPPASVESEPEDPSVGLESVFETAWSFIQEDVAGIMGLHGVGGVGKTTLLKKMNNEFAKRRCGFDVIVWVTISKDINVEDVRKRIREKLGLPLPVSENFSLSPTDIFHNLERKRFVILLDDIWKKVDLESVGIPNPKDPNSKHKSKIVFTTRNYQVCGLMAADMSIKVECLNGDLAMKLFRNRLGQNSHRLHDLEIQKLAESIVKECGGLPLALIVTAATMASQTTAEEWKHAVSTLRENAAEFPGMDEQVFRVLKFSYCNLPNKAIKSCFLFCSLYPEDYEIEIDNLIQQWIGEGHIDEFEEWEDAINKGYYIIGVLKGTCLLEFSEEHVQRTVKMHDVIRDLAHWIARDYGVENDKLLVKTGELVREAPNATKWEKPHTISMMNTRITHLHHIPKCSNLSTFLFRNYHLQSIPDNFFLYIPTLRFLDLSIHNSHDNFFPNTPTLSFLKLDFPLLLELINNQLYSHTNLGYLPTSIGELVKLEYLNLMGTRFEKELPVEMKKLVALKYMFLDQTNKVPVGVIKSFLNLRALGLNISEFGNGKDDDRRACIEELECLPQLKHLQISSSNVSDLQVFLSRDFLASCTWSLDIGKLGVIREPRLPSSLTLSLGCMEKITKLQILDCPTIKELVVDNKSSLKKLAVYNLPRLIVSWDSKAFFTDLHSVEIVRCTSMVNLTWLSLAPLLQYLVVAFCTSLKGILLEEGSVTFDENTFTQLRKLHIIDLPNLQSICSNALPFPSLELINVHGCPHLKKLPLDSTKAKETLVIKGSSNWWNNLEWESESAKSTFTSAFFR